MTIATPEDASAEVALGVSSTANPVTVSDVVELVGRSEVEDIVFYELHAERAAVPTVEEPRGLETMRVMQRRDAHSVEVRCRAEVHGADGFYVVDAAVLYRFHEELQISEAILREFVEKVGVMAVYPYIREAVCALAAKLRLSVPILGIIRSGEVHLTDEPPTSMTPGD